MDLPAPVAGPGQVVLSVLACGVCRTDLHVVDGELAEPVLPLVPGHEIVGVVEALGAGVDHLKVGQRVGVGWLGEACQTCPYCRAARENLCDAPVFTGYTRHGGYATRTVADARYAYPLADDADPAEQAPLLCAGLIGWRSLVMAGEGKALGLYGFGAAAHLVAQAALYQGRDIYAFTGRATSKARPSPARSGRSGRAVRMRPRRSLWTRRSSTPRSAPWSPPPWPRCARAGRWSAPGST
ncbi:alcohol dehydrogenase catalytic domain-containing protein [Phenylobacterium aquaticum]|uniref:alcohol dehydrogenase catalytic domain-containing protein n=1 Tax=Phenylobacterium aquaticum TaxID=1763816 RepID=UPI001F5CB65E|nr:alcohol dehydrogenase catalytic domain-containing protein [Phenylobacterium aquaticum]MCI3134860.1 alcohol dehydrogenase catalytic domain-containing protein [Phenylobacterium aquaticum]